MRILVVDQHYPPDIAPKGQVRHDLPQREYSLRKIRFKHPRFDDPVADKVTMPEVIGEMLCVVSDAGQPEGACRVYYEVMFMGRGIKHSGLYSPWVMRLFKPGKGFLERTANLSWQAGGRHGFRYCRLLASYERKICKKRVDLRTEGR